MLLGFILGREHPMMLAIPALIYDGCELHEKQFPFNLFMKKTLGDWTVRQVCFVMAIIVILTATNIFTIRRLESVLADYDKQSLIIFNLRLENQTWMNRALSNTNQPSFK